MWIRRFFYPITECDGRREGSAKSETWDWALSGAVSSLARRLLSLFSACLIGLFLFSAAISEASEWSSNVIEKLEGHHDGLTERSRETDWGEPNKLPRSPLSDTFDFSFLICGDQQPDLATQGQCLFDIEKNIKKKIHRIRMTVGRMNEYCKEDDKNCLGVIAIGDLTQHSCNQELLVFRQIYENDYPGKDGGDVYCGCQRGDDLYSKGYRIKKPVYLGLGNHDDPSEVHEACDYDSYCYTRSDKTCHSDFVLWYIRSRMYNSDALYLDLLNPVSNWHWSDYGSVYAWEWGNYHFIMGNLWVNYGGWTEDRNSEDCCKLGWLKSHLENAVGRSGKAVVLFQHYGWAESIPGWWSQDNADSLINALCRRDSNEEPCDPYNVVGIFTAHAHQFGHAEIKVYTNEDCTETYTFNNYIVDDAGPGDPASGDNRYVGFYRVNFKYAPSTGYPDKPITMTIDRIRGEFWINSGNYFWNYDDKYYTKHISTSFRDWAQGEPNNGYGNEDCAWFDKNGRFYDAGCSRKEYVVCAEDHDTGGRTWHVLTDQTRTWREAFEACFDSNNEWYFDLPKDLGSSASVRFAEQVALKQAIADAGVERVWINYTDSLKEGDWVVASAIDFYWDDNEPNNGYFGQVAMAGSPVYGKLTHDENCAVLKSNGLMNDERCAGDVHYFACRKKDTANESVEWKITNTPGLWQEGEQICNDLDQEHNYEFKGPDNAEEMAALIGANTDKKSLWLRFHDMDSEGDWVNDAPWTGWLGGQPDSNGTDHCAEFKYDGSKEWGFDDAPCDTRGNGFACRNYVTGEWKVGRWPDTDTEHTGIWQEGFDYCRSLGVVYRFYAPVGEDGKNALENHVGTGSVWVNYTDQPNGAGLFDGVWRPVHWENWAPGEPNNCNGNENCAEMPLTADYVLQWNDVSCDEPRFLLCKAVLEYSGNYSETWHLAYGDPASPDEACHSLNDWFWFVAPDSSSINQKLFDDQVLYQAPLINYSDANYEGNWHD